MHTNSETSAALTILRDAKPLLNRQQYKTLRGQILAGDPRGAVKGMGKILRRRQDTPTDLIRRAVVVMCPANEKGATHERR